MTTKNLLASLHTITAFALAVALTFSYNAAAVSIGKAVLKSGFGEPLLAQVELMTGHNERPEDSCLFLLPPNPSQADASDYLTDANLFLTTEGTQQYINISSSKPANSDIVKLRLKIHCPATRAVIKTVILNSVANTKISANELALLLEQQRLLVSSTLAMQQQIQLLQEEVEGLKSQFARFGLNPPAESIPASASSPATTRAPVHVGSTAETKQPVTQQDTPFFRNELLIALGIVLIALWLGLRLYPKAKVQSESASSHKSTELADARKLTRAPGIKQPTRLTSDNAPPIVLPPKAKVIHTEATPVTLSPPATSGEKKSENDLLLEEAELYANNGHLHQAVEIALDIIKRNPAKANAWTLLFSLYSSLGKVREFEIAAREFLKHHKSSPAWNDIRTLGRTLDQDNPLYADHSSPSNVSPLLPETADFHHPIGDILMDMGILSQREVSSYLSDFNPARHGRFGGYLVARKAITLAQLDQALIQQQGISTETKTDTLPSLQEIEDFLASYDPKRDGSVSQFMAAHNAATPEQLGQLLQQKSKLNGSTTPPQTNEALHFGKASTS